MLIFLLAASTDCPASHGGLLPGGVCSFVTSSAARVASVPQGVGGFLGQLPSDCSGSPFPVVFSSCDSETHCDTVLGCSLFFTGKVRVPHTPGGLPLLVQQSRSRWSPAPARKATFLSLLPAPNAYISDCEFSSLFLYGHVSFF